MSLRKLCRVTGSATYRQAADGAFRNSHHLVSTDGIVDTSWCSGWAGFETCIVGSGWGSGFGERAFDSVISATALRNKRSDNLSLCHGEAGALEALSMLPISAYKTEELNNRTNCFAENVLKGHCICGTPDGTTTPGLMAGLSGVGYSLLRRAFPNALPSILTISLAS